MTKEENTASGPGQQDPDTFKESPVAKNADQDFEEGVHYPTELETLRTEYAVLQDRYLRLAGTLKTIAGERQRKYPNNRPGPLKNLQSKSLISWTIWNVH